MVEINKIQRSIDIISRKSSIPEEGESFDEISEAYDIAVDIMSREIPKMVTVRDWSPACCPRCGRELSEHRGDGWYTHPTFLERCTDTDCVQKLQWPEGI